jgi:hypothetical protein
MLDREHLIAAYSHVRWANLAVGVVPGRGRIGLALVDLAGEITLDELPVELAIRRTGAKRSIDGMVVTEDERLPDTRQVVLAPGQRARFYLAPRIPDQLVTERRWPAWKPWAVTAAGLAAVAGGVALEWRAGVLFARHDAEAGRLCLGQAGCAAEDIPAGLHRQLARAERWQLGAHAVYVVGSLGLASGVVLLYLNRERPVRRRGRLEAPSVFLSPVLAPHVAGLSASVTF